MVSRTNSHGRYRVVQWATGNVGKVAIRHFAENPVFELSAVLVFGTEKVGKDAGELVGIAPIGVRATDDVDAIVGLDVDCVMYAPIWLDVDAVCRLLSSGKNVVSTSGPFYRTEFTAADFDRIEAACQEGRASFHGGGIHPGFAGDLLPLTLARITSRIDQLHVYEVVDFGADPSKYLVLMGMGSDPEQFLTNPSLLGESLPYFAQSMTEIVEGLGETVEKFTHEVEIATATQDIPYRGPEDSDMAGMDGVIEAGTVGAQHHRWTAWVKGAPLVVFHAMYTMGDDVVNPTCSFGRTRYRVVIEGDPATEVVLQSVPDENGEHVHPGYAWTAMDAINTIPAVVDADPGVLTDFDLGLLKPQGLVRSK
jgi:hypothetical protein